MEVRDQPALPAPPPASANPMRPSRPVCYPQPAAGPPGLPWLPPPQLLVSTAPPPTTTKWACWKGFGRLPPSPASGHPRRQGPTSTVSCAPAEKPPASPTLQPAFRRIRILHRLPGGRTDGVRPALSTPRRAEADTPARRFATSTRCGDSAPQSCGRLPAASLLGGGEGE